MTTTTSQTVIQPYLFFEGSCEQALEFYKKTLGAEVSALMRFKDSPDPSMCAAVPPEKIMHASFKIGETVIMASDGRCTGKTSFQGFALSLTLKDIAQAAPAFTALAEGGQVQMPLGKTFYSPAFGMLSDRFGVSWMIYVLPAA